MSDAVGAGPHLAGCLLLRRLVVPHCARGPARCARCAAAVPQLVLLQLDPPGEAARPTFGLPDGTHHTFDVVRVFPDEGEARAFAAAHGITDIELTGS